MNDEQKYFLVLFGVFIEICAFPLLMIFNSHGWSWLVFTPMWIAFICVYGVKVWKAWREMKGLAKVNINFYLAPNKALTFFTMSMLGLVAVIWLPVLLNEQALITVLSPVFAFVMSFGMIFAVAHENRWWDLVTGKISLYESQVENPVNAKDCGKNPDSQRRRH